MRAIWLTDIHLDWMGKAKLSAFLKHMASLDAQVILISGDIADGNVLAQFLHNLERAWPGPIFFVLGNHDYWGSSFEKTHAFIRTLCAESERLKWLTDLDFVPLTDTTALVGHDSWADARYGDFDRSDLLLNDYFLIADFATPDPPGHDPKNRRDRPEDVTALWSLSGPGKASRKNLMMSLGDAAAVHLDRVIRLALKRHREVYVLMHVPPYPEVCLDDGRLCDERGLPHFACKAVGDILLTLADEHREQRLTVLCGHTHSRATANIRANLVVHTGAAEYGAPTIQRIIDIE